MQEDRLQPWKNMQVCQQGWPGPNLTHCNSQHNSTQVRGGGMEAGGKYMQRQHLLEVLGNVEPEDECQQPFLLVNFGIFA